MDGSLLSLPSCWSASSPSAWRPSRGGVDSREFDTRYSARSGTPKENEHVVVFPAPARPGHHRRARARGGSHPARPPVRLRATGRIARPAGALADPPGDRRHGPRLRPGGDARRPGARRRGVHPERLNPAPTRPTPPQRRRPRRAAPFSIARRPLSVAQAMSSAMACQSSVVARSRAASTRAVWPAPSRGARLGDRRRR